MQAVTIDTLINTFAVFSTIIIGIFVLFGSFIIWSGFEMRARADKDIEKIEDTKDEAVKIFLQLKQISEEWKKFSDENMASANESIKSLPQLPLKLIRA